MYANYSLKIGCFRFTNKGACSEAAIQAFSVKLEYSILCVGCFFFFVEIAVEVFVTCKWYLHFIQNIDEWSKIDTSLVIINFFVFLL